MTKQVREEPKIVSAAERQMQAWAHAAETAGHAGAHQPPALRFGPYLAISREKGSGGGMIAEMVAEKLGWELLGRALLDHIATRYHLSHAMLEVVDETKANWAHDVIGTWIDPRVVSHEKYIQHLRHVVLAAAHCGRVVLLGRGAQFFLPAKTGIAVRIVAPEPYRIARLMQEHGVDEKQSRRMMHDGDQDRHDFVARYFRRDNRDPCLYDMVINVANHGPDAAANVIVELCRRLETREETRRK
jgi:cytidylate kinase